MKNSMARVSLMTLAALCVSGCASTKDDFPHSAAVGTEEMRQDESMVSEELLDIYRGEENNQDAMNLEFSVAGSTDAIPELSASVIEQIADLNEGIPPGTVLESGELDHYYALIGTHIIIAKDRDSGEIATGRGRLTLYVPNLIEGLENVSALLYDKADSCWKVIPAESVDTDAKTVTVTITGSCVLTIIYERQTAET